MPASRYPSPEWFRLEQERIFRGPVWLRTPRLDIAEVRLPVEEGDPHGHASQVRWEGDTLA